MYTDNQMFVKIDGGLTRPFVTTLGLKQGCIFSPLLFNLYVNKLPDVYDSECHPVFVNGKPVHCLMWRTTAQSWKKAQNVRTRRF